MAERWYHYYDGSDANDGLSPEAPRKLIPGQVGATTVSAGDIINVRNGVDFSGGGRVSAPAYNNLTFRGYGMADNVLETTQPVRFAPWLTTTRRIVREAGVHEGMWILRGDITTGGTPFACGQARSGTTVEDISVIGADLTASWNAIALGGTTVVNGSGTALRRFSVDGAGGSGVFIGHNSPTVEDGRVQNVAADCITVRSGDEFNGSRLGSVDVFRRLHLSEPNVNQSTGIADGVIGDLLQYSPSTGNQMYASAQIEDIYGYKTSFGKQAFVLHDAVNGITVRRFHLVGGGNLFIMVGPTRGAVLVEDFYVGSNFCAPDSGYHFMRFSPGQNPTSYGWDTGSSVRLRRGVIAAQRVPGVLRTAWEFTGDFTFDGLVEVENITTLQSYNDAVLNNYSGESVIATLALRSSRCTYGNNFQFRARNNRFGTTGRPHVTLPSGMENTNKFIFSGNSVAPANFTVGDISYPDLATFQAAHSAATGNLDTDPQITAAGIPKPGSPLLNQGADLGPRRDIRGFQGRKFIGAYGPARLVAE